MIRLYLTRLPGALPPKEGRAAASCAAYALLRYAMAHRGYTVDSLEILRTSEGKPYFAGHEAEFSISHSGPWAVCAISEGPVGVDIERIRPVSPALWKRYLASSPDEPYGGDREAILRWTRYEAALKREGKITSASLAADFTTLQCIPAYLITLCGDRECAPIQWVAYGDLIN